MNCPECNNNALKIHEDPIVCTDCDTTILIEYFMCNECSYSFRTTNSKFIDGSYPVDIEKVMDELMNDVGCIADDIMGSARLNEPMADSLYNCIKCGQSLIFDPNAIEYNCPYCGFEWEILRNE